MSTRWPILLCGLLAALPAARSARGAEADWPQLQRDGARTAFTREEVPPPFRAR